MSYITTEDVRDFIWDRSIEGNELQMDLTFSDEEIEGALKRAAREYNSLPPLVSTADPRKLSDKTNMFLDGAAQQLFISRLSKLSRNDMDFTAGNVQTNIVQKQIQHLQNLIKEHGERFRTAVQTEKIAKNIRQGFGHY